ncbi:hypothetical protein COCC4DRAFT_143533 [Bipolaris maydis ATCC 48331]|uniref:HTH CENPB-type domain-containing protein n=1 Tax=Cochliobolus heterostrophus (strain C4 / ATCC 48331 / race T) TaxID=665024 RepID=N4X3X9_COCH4|nr:uncharacterized protein COCC4DRAFT_143533 [Bipolaris maydis ATCC 48331]ENI03183.1 hypothetical protein COCC4DRAFT_143533 [Bipolaris maydis ATCC 48331]
MVSRFGSYEDVEKRIQNACAAYNSKNPQKITDLALDFVVPYHRLRRRLQGGNSKSERPPTNMRLTPAAEAALRLYITRCDQLGMPALVPQLKNAVQYLLDLEEPTGYAPKVGQHFITRWLQRNPDCRRVKQKPREITRTAAAAEEAYKAHFDAVKEIKYRHGILPADTYNMDETGFRIGCGGSQWIITMD